MSSIFPFAQFWPFYLTFSLTLAALLYGSVRTFPNRETGPNIKEATVSAAGWFMIALLFNLFLYIFTYNHLNRSPELVAALKEDPSTTAQRISLEFLSGYLVEKALAVDNLFVFIVIFRMLAIPAGLQRRVLFYGLFGAIVLRAIFIALGSAVMSFHLVVIIFGLFLIYQGSTILFGADGLASKGRSRILPFLSKYLPLTDSLNGERFFVRENNRFLATPLFLALLVIEITDIMFAFDSVPAIFGLTKEPLVVFTSNIFAVIDLRSLYFLLAAFISRFHYLNIGLAIVLIFIGAKMAFLDYFFGGKFPTEWSLLLVLLLIGGSILISFLRPPKTEEGSPGAGSDQQ